MQKSNDVENSSDSFTISDLGRFNLKLTIRNFVSYNIYDGSFTIYNFWKSIFKSFKIKVAYSQQAFLATKSFE